MRDTESIELKAFKHAQRLRTRTPNWLRMKAVSWHSKQGKLEPRTQDQSRMETASNLSLTIFHDSVIKTSILPTPIALW